MGKPLKAVVYRGTYTRLWKWPKLKTEAGRVLEVEVSSTFIFFSHIFLGIAYRHLWSRILGETDISLP